MMSMRFARATRTISSGALAESRRSAEARTPAATDFRRRRSQSLAGALLVRLPQALVDAGGDVHVGHEGHRWEDVKQEQRRAVPRQLQRQLEGRTRSGRKVRGVKKSA